MTQSITTEQLWDETRRLTAEIEELQIRLEYLLDNAGEDDIDTWNVWPYSWAIAGWNHARQRFHSFHENHEKQLAPDTAFEATCPLRLV
jgi:hypothetical protein